MSEPTNKRLKALQKKKMGSTSSQAVPGVVEGEDNQVTAEADKVEKASAKLSKRRRSSAVGSTEQNNGIAGRDMDSSGRRKRRKKKGRESTGGGQTQEGSQGTSLPQTKENQVIEEDGAVSPQQPIGEETESAMALLQLRKGDITSSRDGALDLAAQQQLESSTMKAPKRRKKAEKTVSKPKTSKRRSKIAVSQQTASGSLAEELPEVDALSSASLPALATAATRNGDFPHQVSPKAVQQLPLSSTLNLDDIPSDDEAIAPLLQSYQNGRFSPHSGLHDQLEDEAVANSYTQLASEAFEKATTAATHSNDDLPQLLRTLGNGNKKGRKRNKKLPEYLFGSDDDEIGAAPSGSTEPRALYSSGVIDDAIPVDPKLSAHGFSVMRIENYQHPDTDEPELPKQVKPGKLKRLSGRMQGRRASAPKTTLDDFVIRGQDAVNDQASLELKDAEAFHESTSENVNTPASSHKKRPMPSTTPASMMGKFSSSVRKASSSAPRLREYIPTPTEIVDNNGGPFTSEEIDIIYAFRDAHCAQHDWSHRRFAEQVHANARNHPSLNVWWSEICGLLPYRKRQPIQKFCRRKFHNFEKRGAWTLEEDEMLKRAVAEKGKSWKAVGEMCDRMAEDVRDRWRNYHHNAGNRNTEAWTEEEVKSLVRAVGECIWLMQEDRRQERDMMLARTGFATEVNEELAEDELEKLIHWQVVSDRMGGGRSRLQCSYKWKALKMAGRTDFTKSLNKARKIMSKLQDGEGEFEQTKPDWRMARSRKKVEENMLPGDRYDILEALLRCGAAEESQIRWQTLGKGHNWRLRWTTVDLKAAWAIFKEEIGETGDLDTRYSEVVSQLLSELMRDYGERLEERWIPPEGFNHRARSNDAESNDDGEVASSNRPRKPRAKAKRRRAYLSADFVDESNDERNVPSGSRYRGLAIAPADDFFVPPAPASVEEEDDDARLVRQLQLLKDV
ncbi:RNA polymerase I enhancer binding protein [Ptychographa xylographoides]|nr:RNA polymerase I enhancer binding protein [Ptychographa xylographoides]